MSVQFCLALLALSSLAAASDPDCEELLKPLAERNRVLGRWIMYAGTSENKLLLNELRIINSSWIELTAIPDSDDVTLRWGDKMGEVCHTGSTNFTFSENDFKVTFNYSGSHHEHFGKYLASCPDCLLWVDSDTGKGRGLFLFTKSGTLDDSQQEVFKKQTACLGFPTEFHIGATTDLCPDEKAAASDVKEVEQ